MAYPFRQVEVGGTYQFTWTASTNPSSLSMVIKTASDTIVASVAAISSGTGAWYAFATIPDSFGKYPSYLLQQWTATASTPAGSASPFITKQVFEVIKTQAFVQGRLQ
jgi:hypothetical protein